MSANTETTKDSQETVLSSTAPSKKAANNEIHACAAFTMGEALANNLNSLVTQEDFLVFLKL